MADDKLALYRLFEQLPEFEKQELLRAAGRLATRRRRPAGRLGRPHISQITYEAAELDRPDDARRCINDARRGAGFLQRPEKPRRQFRRSPRGSPHFGQLEQFSMNRGICGLTQRALVEDTHRQSG
jgi:hypothetical protein